MSGREIKFRGKRIDNGEWIYGSYLHQYYSIKNQGLIDAIAYTDRNQTFRPQIDPRAVSQFIGLRDNKRTEEYPEGQEVYEGDIFRHQFSDKIRGIVKFGEYQNPNDDGHGGHVGFYVDWKGDNGLYRKDLAYWVKVSRVIGNIYENHELMGGKG